MKNKLLCCFTTAPQGKCASAALLFLRLVAGAAFMFHGWGKIQNPMSWMGPESPVPGFLQFLAAFSEFGGGLAWMVGLLTPLFSLGLMFTMIVATLLHMMVLKDPFVAMKADRLTSSRPFISRSLFCSYRLDRENSRSTRSSSNEKNRSTLLVMAARYQDRRDAGRKLAAQLPPLETRNLLVLGLPRGGVPVAFEVAQALHAPLDVFIVRKLGVPGQEEFAMGAIASGGVRVLDEEVIRAMRVRPEDIERITQKEKIELERREHLFRGDRPPLDLHGKSVLLVDDGLATGSTMRAAIEAVRLLHPQCLYVAVPIAAESTCQDLAPLTDGLFCPCTPSHFRSVGSWYEDFGQTSEEEVRALTSGSS